MWCCLTFVCVYIHHFKSDKITNMDHMRISGTEPSSVIQNDYFQIKK